MGLKKFIVLEIKKILGGRHLIVVLIFLLTSGYFIQSGITQYKMILEEKNRFMEFERDKYKYFIYPAKHGNYGVRLLYIPSPLMAFFNSGPVPNFMTTFIDGSERMLIYHPLKGQNGFSMINSAFMTFAGFLLLFGSGLALIYGFCGARDHGWLTFLESMVGGRGRLSAYLLISRTLLLALFCLVLAGISLGIFALNHIPVSIGRVSTLFLGAFIMLFCYLLVGLNAGMSQNRFRGRAIMSILWFLTAFLVPVLSSHWTYARADSITSTFKVETLKQKIFQDYEKNSLERGGKFDYSKRGSELEKDMFILFWNGGFKQLMEYEAQMLDEIKENVSFFQTLSGFFPSTFYLSLSSEMSSRGFGNLVDFNEYSQEIKKAYIWYLAQNYLLSTRRVFPPFIKDTENVYHGRGLLPGHFGFGLTFTVLWIFCLLTIFRVQFNRLGVPVPGGTGGTGNDPNNELGREDFKKNKINVVLTSDQRLYDRFLARLRVQSIDFTVVPGPACLPGECRARDLFRFFNLEVPPELRTKLPQKTGDYIHALDPADRARIWLAIIALTERKSDIFVFNNFLSGQSDVFAADFVDFLNSLKKGRLVVYFSDSFLMATRIADYVLKFSDEPPLF